VRGAIEHIVDLSTCRERATRAKGSPGVISPDRRFAATVATTRKGVHGTEAIVVRNRTTGSTRTIYRLRESYRRAPRGFPGPIVPFKWSGDDRWIFFAIDPQGSASLAADGMEVEVVSAKSGRPHSLGFMLAYPDYLAWCNRRAVFTSGGDRRATTNKQLLVAGPPSWKPRRLVRLRNRAWGSLVCALDGRSVVVQSQRDDGDYSFSQTNWALWRVGLDGSLRWLTSPPRSYADESPRLAPDRSVLFVRTHREIGKLYALRRGRVLGPLLTLGPTSGYYGHRDWWSG
jgi:hypothetical protein